MKTCRRCFRPGTTQTGLHNNWKWLVSMATDRSHGVIIETTASPGFSAVFGWILFILAGNNDIHENLDEFEIRSESNTDYGVKSS